MQTAIPISMENTDTLQFENSMVDTDTLQDHYQPTNDISEEVLALIKAWEESFSKITRHSPKQQSNDLDIFIPTDLSLPPHRFRRNPAASKRGMKMD